LLQRAVLIQLPDADGEKLHQLAAVVFAAIDPARGIGLVVAGAVYSPEELIVPTTESPPAIPFTDLEKLAEPPPCNVAANCFVSAARTDTVAGETVTPAETGAGAPLWPLPFPAPLSEPGPTVAQPDARSRTPASHRRAYRCRVTV